MAKQYIRYNFDNAISEREKQHNEIAYRAAAEGIVLLENDGCLPLKDKKVALFGVGARHTIKGGSGSGEVNNRENISLYEGMVRRGFEITSGSWLDKYDVVAKAAENPTPKEFFKNFNLGDAMAMFMGTTSLPDLDIQNEDIQDAPAETAIYVVSRQAGEGGDRKIERGENDLTKGEIESLKRLVASYKNVVLVINIGSSMNMDFLDQVPGIGAVLFIAQLGSQGGYAFADVLTGDVNPSGKLTDTWAKKYDDIPYAREWSYLNGNLKQEYYKEGILVGYRYFDSYNVEPLYPFGYGLSYTTFSVEPESVSVKKTDVTAKVKVTNTGKVAGKEVVQLYVSCPNGVLKKEYQSLAAFAKTGVLEPGASEEVTLQFPMSLVASYKEYGAQFILDAGDYVVRIGNSSRNTKAAAVIKLDKYVVVEQAKNVCPVLEDFEQLEIPDHPEEDLKGVPTVKMRAANFETVYHDYSMPKAYHDPKVDAIVDKMSLKEKAEVCVGASMFSGNRTVKIEGAVGHSTSKFWKKYGLPSVEFSDGPAGLRITRYTGVYPNGKVKAMEGFLGGVDLFLNMVPVLKKVVYANPDKVQVAYQYPTAFPTEIAEAQTWNTDLLHEIGVAIAKECQEFGITYWLAPALNIHRNPLCGRNFEYYSEDPVVSGKMASAVISGVQSIPGIYVAAKHYCCNNQEDNRNFVSSNIYERPLREIYVKGFRMLVEEAKATGIM
ncbi:MAG TPA: glycoside hydrolase family 3 C-terminal domain-containing protein, partial [Clostridiales bacterium]|nr:glycoside hydrolase family 3 C-terminal domain-containing protein [Clostridiales bacterium]